MGAGTTAWRLTNWSNDLGGFADKTSYNLGENVVLKIGRVGAPNKVNLAVYRMGYYGGTGGRLVYSASNVSVTNTLNCNPFDDTTGKLDCTNWAATYTIPGSSLPTSGVYLVKLTATDSGIQNHIIFDVRDDSRASKVIFQVPMITYQAYNWWGGKCLYTWCSSGFNTIAGTPRAVKDSFDRPYINSGNQGDWFLKADYAIVYWMERQGYDVTYTDGVSIDQNPSQLLNHKVVVAGAHDEYWTVTQMQAFKMARDSGVSVVSFGANNAYWKVRLEDSRRTLVDYKTVEGTGSTGSGAAGVNDWGPDGIKGTADDALGADGIAGTSDDHPENSTTTFRDNGAPKGDPNAPSGGRVGPNMPENSLWGNMYIGDNDAWSYALVVPGGNAQGEYAADRIWRNTGISNSLETDFTNSKLVGWEWDAIPSQAQYLAQEPSGVKRVTGTPTLPAPNPPEFITDEGRVYSSNPPAGQANATTAVKYTAPSGALVFSAGTNQWSWGLGPHFIDRPGYETYSDPPTDSSDPRIQQATYNILSDAGVQPNTPSGITLDGSTNRPPTASFTATPNPANTGQTVTFNASASADPDGTIADYQWDLDGNGTYETDTGTTATVTKAYSTAGTIAVGLKVTDNSGASDSTSVNLTVGSPNAAPTASFTISPNPAAINQVVTFNASGSSDSDGTIVHYEWDLDGNGTYETDGGTSATVSHTYTTAGPVTIGLRVTDNGGAQATTTKTLTIGSGNAAPTAAFTISPNPTVTGVPVTFDATGSSDPDGTIAHYEWDLDGNGTYETDGGTNPKLTHSYSITGSFNVGLRVTDNSGATSTIQHGISIGSAATGPYASAVAGTSGLLSYWRLGESGGTTIVDSVGANTGTLSGGASLGVTGALAGSTDTAARFDGTSGAGQAPLNLSSTQKVTVEFWLKWNAYANDDKLAMEFTPNFNSNAGGFIVDPNDVTGKFAVGLGMNGSRNNIFFTRPSAGVWHHYAFVMDTSAAAASQITPYVDGVAMSYTKLNSGTGAGAFANSNLYLMSRGGSSLFGAGDLDEVAMYGTTLSAATIANHFAAGNGNHAPTASFTVSPNPAAVGQSMTFDASGSSDSDGTIAHYEWDLDGNGTYETDGGASPIISHTYTSAGSFSVGLRVTDNGGAQGTTTKAITINAGNAPPTAAFTVSPNPTVTGVPVSFNASGSADSDGTIAHYEWDLDGNGTYETDGGTSPTLSKTYSSTGTFNVGLRVTDNSGATATVQHSLTVGSGPTGPYGTAVAGTTGLLHYWRLGEASGTSIIDAVGSANGTYSAATLGVPGALANDSDTAARFNGTSSSGQVPLDLSSTQQVTMEFWLKWSSYANDDKLAMEFTPNFNSNSGGFVVDPDDSGGKFAVGLGMNGSRNNVTFARPSAGAWHYYAFVLDTSAAAGSQITPYVDGVAVPYTKVDSGTGAGTFANSNLYLMSRGGSSMFGTGDLDEVAVYSKALSASTIQTHYGKGTVNNPPTASFTATPNPATVGQSVTFDASGSSDDGAITHYEWDLDGNGTYETDGGTTPTVTKSYSSAGSVSVGLRVTDNGGAQGTTTKTLTVNNPNSAPSASFTASPNPVAAGHTVTFDGSASSDSDGSIADYKWDLDGDGAYETDTGTTATVTKSYSSAGSVTVGLKVTDNGGSSGTATKTVTVTAPPKASFTATPNPAAPGASVTLDASGSTSGASITHYEWDLDGNGSYETDGGTSATRTASWNTAGPATVGLRITDANGDKDTTTRTITISSPYATSVLGTTGIKGYWRLGDSTGTTLASSTSAANGTMHGGTFGVAGALTGDSDTALRFNGTSDWASALLDLSGTKQVTVEFWLKWNAYANDDKLAMEFTRNFNNVAGGFIVDPNDSSGKFAVGLGLGSARNNVFFTRPSAGAWHYYAFVMDTTLSGATQITPYVDGVAVPYTKLNSGTGAGFFADSTLYLMSRGGTALFGAGDLDEVAIYTQPLGATTVQTHYNKGTGH